MKFLKERAEKRKQEFLSHVSPEILKLVESKTVITLQKYQELRMNSYERQMLFPLLDDEALIWLTKHALMQEGKTRVDKFTIPVSYTDAVVRLYIHEIIKRFKL